jgi:hypothetical protein
MTEDMPLSLKTGLWLERVLPWRYTRGLEERNSEGIRGYYAERALRTRPYPTGGDRPYFEVHALMGKRHLGMTLWAVKSFLQQTGRKYQVVLHDDGSLKDADLALLQEHFPGVRVIQRRDADDAVRQKLAGYPNCQEYRFGRLESSNHRGQSYDMFIMSLILFDICLLTEAEKVMIMDVDVLFFQRPDEIVDWVEDASDQRTLYSVEAYKPYRDEKNRLQYTSKAAQTLNSGLLCIHRESVYDLDKIERWIGENKDLMYTSPVFEQLCYSSPIKPRSDSVPLPPAVYSFNYHGPESKMTHFGMKRFFFENLPRLEPELSAV